MKYTHHARVRMSQRGIPDRLIAITQKYGRMEGDRRVLDRQTIREILAYLAEERALLMKVMDKGGLALATADETVITAFNLDQGYCRG